MSPKTDLVGLARFYIPDQMREFQLITVNRALVLVRKPVLHISETNK